jgi:transcriptional regulator with XRE-family HTH domain
VKDLLKALGRNIHDLRVAGSWSQEEFAHLSGLHRTYVGQVERGEKNISFENLVKISGALGISVSDLLGNVESGSLKPYPAKLRGLSERIEANSSVRLFEIQRLVRRLRHQQSAMNRTIEALEQLSQGATATHRKRARTD